MGARKTVPKKIEKQIFQEANSMCPFCAENDVTTLEIHHIKAIADGGSDEPNNLILTCANCHSKITNGTITKEEVYQKKLDLISRIGQHEKSSAPESNIVYLNGSTNTGIIANKLNCKLPSKPKIILSGTIATDRDKYNYIKHLIKRYNEFSKVNKSDTFKYVLIYKAIEREFKWEWKDAPIEKFDDLVIYLHKRIDYTMLGRIRKKRGQKNYSSFAEFLDSQSTHDF